MSLRTRPLLSESTTRRSATLAAIGGGELEVNELEVDAYEISPADEEGGVLEDDTPPPSAATVTAATPPIRTPTRPTPNPTFRARESRRIAAIPLIGLDPPLLLLAISYGTGVRSCIQAPPPRPTCAGAARVRRDPARASRRLAHTSERKAQRRPPRAERALDKRSGRSEKMGGTGLEPVTPSLSSWCSPN